jgi:ribose transport system permease protein
MSALRARANPLLTRARHLGGGQEQVLLLVVIVLCAVFAATLPGFRSVGNALALLTSISVLGILGIGMGVVVIGRGIDLSQVAVMAIAAAISIVMLEHGMNEAAALLAGLGVAVAMGLVNGYLIAFVEIPALFTTLATGLLFFGAARLWALPNLIQDIPHSAGFLLQLGQRKVVGIPMPVIVFAGVAILVHLFLSRTSVGRFIYAHGDNSQAAALTGIPVRPYTVLEYTISAVIGYVAGLVLAGSISSMDTQVINGTLIFNVILVVVLGGISLVGGRGSVWSVVVGALLIGTLLNGMTLMNLSNDVQDIAKGVVLLAAIILDNRLHPRDEETVRQGD